MTPAAVDYVHTQIVDHARLFFEEPSAQLLNSETVRFVSYADAEATRGPRLAIPVDIPVPAVPEKSWQVPFNDTILTLWNRVPRPQGDGWKTIPDESQPVWHRHESGTLIPAWNLFGNVFDLLTFGEEQRITKRDSHGRFASQSSPRMKAGLLEVPAVNEAVALLVAAAGGLKNSGQPSYSLDDQVKLPVVVLSHDCDNLAGNDLWTQAIRLYRVVQPLTKLRLPKPANLWWFLRNVLTPHRFYADNVTGMVDIERCFGGTSTMYLLNGTGGRFGARSKFSEIRRLMPQIPSSWDVGIHYNYDTFLDRAGFAAQMKQLQEIVPNPLVSGRAHYLRFDPVKSFEFLSEFGIYADESSGWADYVGYRNGIAGCFQAYDVKRQTPLDIWEVPMVVMEDALVDQHGGDAVAFVENQLRHLSRVGGAYTILVHPGQFCNPEHPSTLGLYHELLKVCRRVGVSYTTARTLVDRART